METLFQVHPAEMLGLSGEISKPKVSFVVRLFCVLITKRGHTLSSAFFHAGSSSYTETSAFLHCHRCLLACLLQWDVKGLFFLSEGELIVCLNQTCGRDTLCPVRPISNVEGNVDIDMGTCGYGADDVGAGGLRRGLSGDAGLERGRLRVGL